MTDSAIVALIQSSSPDAGLMSTLERFGSIGWVPLAAFFVFLFRRELQEWMRVRLRIMSKKDKRTVSSDTDGIKINGHDPVVLQSNCHEAMNKMETLIGGISQKIDDGFSDVNNKLFELARDK